ncbi:AAA family ATPase [Nocardia jiangsuensis]|uniref:AAA family ATPase n=1 Tax=Nocardia jiangsuensis TaxID=1691563 RepID=A0ABV8E345_9NOCA
MAERSRAGGRLVVLRGNSGSGKSTVARQVQERFPRGTCAVVSQDYLRRIVLREPDRPGAFNVTLIETVAGACLERGLVVIVEGIFDARRYSAVLARLADRVEHPLFYAWDLPFEETTRRHTMRSQSSEFTATQMSTWYHGWQFLDFTSEFRLDAQWPARVVTDRIVADLDAIRSAFRCPPSDPRP